MGDPVSTCEGRKNGAGRGRIGCLSTGTGNQDGGVAHCDSIHGERNISGVLGVV